MLPSVFTAILLKHTSDRKLIEELWQEIALQYSGKKRHYHNFSHLENMYAQLSEVKGEINDWDIVMLAMFYHDLIYKATHKDNEEKSAKRAERVLQLLGVEEKRIAHCTELILATKGHSHNIHHEINIFTDADLSILGLSDIQYQAYYQQVRKEYSIYPGFMYKPGRKKVLEHFLKMERIFKSEYFFQKFEKQARKNLETELVIY